MRLVGYDNGHGWIHWYDADNPSGFLIHFAETPAGTYWIGWWDSYAQFRTDPKRWKPDGTWNYDNYIEVQNAAEAREIGMDWFEAFWLEGGF